MQLPEFQNGCLFQNGRQNKSRKNEKKKIVELFNCMKITQIHCSCSLLADITGVFFFDTVGIEFALISRDIHDAYPWKPNRCNLQLLISLALDKCNSNREI